MSDPRAEPDELRTLIETHSAEDSKQFRELKAENAAIRTDLSGLRKAVKDDMIQVRETYRVEAAKSREQAADLTAQMIQVFREQLAVSQQIAAEAKIDREARIKAAESRASKTDEQNDELAAARAAAEKEILAARVAREKAFIAVDVEDHVADAETERKKASIQLADMTEAQAQKAKFRAYVVTAVITALGAGLTFLIARLTS